MGLGENYHSLARHTRKTTDADDDDDAHADADANVDDDDDDDDDAKEDKNYT